MPSNFSNNTVLSVCNVAEEAISFLFEDTKQGHVTKLSIAVQILHSSE